MEILIAIVSTALIIHSSYWLGFRYRGMALRAQAQTEESAQGHRIIQEQLRSAHVTGVMLARTHKREGRFTIPAAVAKSVLEYDVMLDPQENGSVKVLVKSLGK